MLELAIIASAFTAVAGPGYLGTSYQRPHMVGGSLLATMPNYPAGRADNVHRPGFNGRLFIGRPIIGGRPEQWPMGWGDPGPAAYGAYENDGSQVYARTNTLVQTVSPWISIPQGGLNDLEQARNEWLKENGYVGGVRTFVNDAYMPVQMASGEQIPARRQITPSATIQLPADMPSFRYRQQVMHLKAGDRVSLPGHAPAAMLARLNKSQGVKLASK